MSTTRYVRAKTVSTWRYLQPRITKKVSSVWGIVSTYLIARSKRTKKKASSNKSKTTRGSILDWMRDESLSIGSVVILLAAVLGLSWWIESMIAEVALSLSFPSVPSQYLWWALGATLAITFLIWLFWSPTRRGYATTAIGSVRRIKIGWILWPVAILVVYFLGVQAVESWEHRAEEALKKKEAQLQAHREMVERIAQDHTLRPGKSVEAVMPPYHRLDGWVDEDLVTSRVERRGGDKVRIFTLKKGVMEEVTIRLSIYPCSKLAPC